jgi:Flp pilus assembly protein TadG
MRLLRHLLGDVRGAAIIELALAAPILAIMISGVADISIAFGRELELEQGVQRAIERVMQTTGEDTVEATIAAEALCQVNGRNGSDCYTSPLEADDITVKYRMECTDSAGTMTPYETDSSTTFAGWNCGGGESEARYIGVTATETYTPIFPIHFLTASDGKYHLSATAGMRTT